MSDLGWHPLKVTVYVEAAYVKRREGEVARSDQVHEAVLLDLDENGNLLGVEVLGSVKEKNASTE